MRLSTTSLRCSVREPHHWLVGLYHACHSVPRNPNGPRSSMWNQQVKIRASRQNPEQASQHQGGRENFKTALPPGFLGQLSPGWRDRDKLCSMFLALLTVKKQQDSKSRLAHPLNLYKLNCISQLQIKPMVNFSQSITSAKRMRNSLR